MTRSAIYTGHVFHDRLEPRAHSFRYAVRYLYLDLDELPGLFEGRWLWSARRPNVAWFRRADYMGPADRPLREAVLDRVHEELGRRPGGRMGLLTQLRTLGYLFNPVTFYFCHDADERLDAIVAEITNTPWGERHAYVLDAAGCDPDELFFRFRKDFHVSPFFDMDHVYEWRFSPPGERLEVSMTNRQSGRAVFHAGLRCSRRAITARSLASLLARSPLQPLRLHAAIYWQAALLFLKRTPFFTHPRKRVPFRDATIS